LDFEKEYELAIEDEKDTAQTDEDDEDDPNENPHSAAAISRRYRKFQKQKERERKLEEKQKIQSHGGEAAELAGKFKGIISGCFDSYMNIYVSQEDSLMKAKFDSIIQEEKWDVDDDAKNKVLPSSTELTFYFKGE
jgi:vacuolar protein sorting-associated protein 53